MSQTSDRQQAKRDFLNLAKVIFSDGKFSDWILVMIFLSIPVALGISLYMLLEGCLRNVILPILLSPFARSMSIDYLGSWVIGYIKIGAMLVDILAFAIISYFLFFMSKVIRKVV
jgi:large-conductance mechanosensitive channel